MDPSEWKKPSDVMKIHRRRKSVSQRRITSDPDKRTSIIYKSPSKSVKRKNPFHRDSPHPFPSKRQHIDFKENTHQEQQLSCQLFSILDTVNEVRTCNIVCAFVFWCFISIKEHNVHVIKQLSFISFFFFYKHFANTSTLTQKIVNVETIPRSDLL